MTPSAWHAPADVRRRFALDPGSVDGATASSIELHLLECDSCRRDVAAVVPGDLLDEMWAETIDRVDRPRAGLVERFLLRIGVPESSARLVGATAALRLAWLAAVAAVILLVVASRRTEIGQSVFLFAAPALPLGSVAIVFAAGREPGGEAAAATPVSGATLLLRRAAAVFVTTVALLLIGALSVPGLGTLDAVWALPALALTLGALALATRVPPQAACAGLASAWAVACFVAREIQHVGTALTDLAVFAPAAQVGYALVAAVALAVVVARRETLLLPFRP